MTLLCKNYIQSLNLKIGKQKITAQNTMTVSRALTWLKHFIPTWSNQVAKRAGDVIVNGRSFETSLSEAEVRAELATSHQSIMDQVKAVYDKRKAINDANQETKITVAGKEYTIADAMIYRQHAIPLLEQYVSQASTSIVAARRKCAEQNAKYQNAVQAQTDPTEASLQSIKALFEPHALAHV